MIPKVRRAQVSVPMTLWLLLLWLAVFRSITPMHVAGGLLVAFAVQLLFPLPTSTHLWRWRFFPVLYLAVRFGWDLIVAGLQVAWVVVSGKTHDDGIVRCDLRSNDPVYMTIVAAMTSMVPGTIVVEASRERRALYLHVLDLRTHGGIAGVRRAVRAQEARVLLAFAPALVLRECELVPPRLRRARGEASPPASEESRNRAALPGPEGAVAQGSPETWKREGT